MEKDGSADGVDVKHYKVGAVYAKQVHIKAGKVLVGHEHTYDHMSILASGKVEVTVDGETTLYVGPFAIGIAAYKKHIISAISNSLWYCVHAVPEDLPIEDSDEWLVS
jgi:quercetin dioxygenase-like cupin family protein